ncbi:MAG: FliM/FliN family flagellar motor C-terminal domain-containing protein [Planctomycetia bacterium]|nr:FliM/FliN family flagellar motor C-terminal domain-containing protein [Planctomycetia bacterium]
MNYSDLPEQGGNFIRQRLTDLCRTPVEISFRSLKKMNIDTCFDKKIQNRIFVQYGSRDDVFFLAEFNQGFLIFLLNRQLGFDLSFDRCNSDDIPLTFLERRSLSFLLKPFSRLADMIIDSNKMDLENSLSPQILSEEADFSLLKPEDCCVMIYECAAETSLSTISLLIPLRFLNRSLREDLDQQNRNIPEKEENSVEESDKPVREREICVKIGQAEIPFEELSQLKRGDMIPTSLLADALFIVEVDGIPRFKGRPGFFEGAMAVELIDRIG